MVSADETRRRLQHMREKADELTEAAERTDDPEERQRLRHKARRLKSQSEQESGMSGGDIHPPM